MADKSTIARCSFCNRPRNEVKGLISGQDAEHGPFICNRCIEQGFKAFAAEQKKAAAADEKEAPLKKPMEIKAYLDERVIAQDKAKTDVAIAIYNHYRRREALRQGVDLGDVEIEKSNILMMGPSGCHRRGQKVLMFDGTLLAVENVVVGDQLMGPDSTPRTVLELHRGVEEMVEIVPTKGEPWVVNRGHILTLVRTSKRIGKRPGRAAQYMATNDVKDVPVRDYLKWSRTQKSIHKLFRVPVDFAPGDALPLDPYFLGVLLGDGSLTSTPRVTTTDEPVLNEARFQAEAFGLGISKYHYSEARCPQYALAGGMVGGRTPNPIGEVLRTLGLLGVTCEAKFIPHAYKTASREDRLALLAGLIDTDGSLTCNCFDINMKSKAIIEDIAFVARSLGLAAYVSPSRKCDQNGTWGDYFRVSISGHTDQIPVRIEHKRAHLRKQVKNVLRTGFTTRDLPSEEYFGFVLDGDHRYLLDDYTVTHNTGKTHIARALAKMLNVPFFIGDATKLTAAGYVGDDVESLLQGLMQEAGNDIERAQWGIVLIDEFDKIARKSGRGATGFRDVGGEMVQQAILKLLEGSKVAVPRGNGMRVGMGGAVDVLDTTNVLFICAGSFAGMEEVISKRVNKSASLGFGAAERQKLSTTETYLAVTEDDVLEFGLIPEVMGRLPVLTTTVDLTESEMVQILTEPKNAIIKQFKALFSLDGIDLQFDDAALIAVAREAKKRPTGARALRSIVEQVLQPYSFESRSQPDIKTIRITEETVDKSGSAVIIRKTPKEPLAVAQA